MGNKLEATVSCVIEDDNHCSEDCGWICKPSVWDASYPYHYCCFSNSRGSKMLRSQSCKIVFGNRPATTPRKRRTKAEMEEAKSGK